MHFYCHALADSLLTTDADIPRAIEELPSESGDFSDVTLEIPLSIELKLEEVGVNRAGVNDEGT